MSLLTCSDSVQHGECVMGCQGCHVKVVDTGLLCSKCRQLMEVRGKHTEAADLGCYVFTNGPGQSKAIVGGRAPAQLIDYDQRFLCG